MTVISADVETVRRFYQALAARDTATLESCSAPGAVRHLPGKSPIAGDHHGWPAIRDDFLAKLGPLSGHAFRAELLDVAVGREFIVAVQHATASYQGAAPGYHRLPAHAAGARPHRTSAGTLL
jgi:uncharacterized protein